MATTIPTALPTDAPSERRTESPVAVSCEDGQQNGDETDVDCGGSCRLCESGQACRTAADCGGGGRCEGQVCTTFTPTASPTVDPTAYPTSPPPPATALEVIQREGILAGRASNANDDSGTDLSSCTANPLWIGDAYCDVIANVEECAWDGGDCCLGSCVDTVVYTCGAAAMDCQDPLFVSPGSSYGGGAESLVGPVLPAAPAGCFVATPSKLGDGRCDAFPYNTEACLYDGGDCCPETCFGVECGSVSYPFHCVDPTMQALADCGAVAELLQWRGDGLCDDGVLNTAECGYDGGDCCPETCVGALCGVGVGFVCKELQLPDEEEDATAAEVDGTTRVRFLADSAEAEVELEEEDFTEGTATETETDVVLATSLRHCLAEMETCAMDVRCLTLFAEGVNSLAHAGLWGLWECLYAQEGFSESGAQLSVLSFSAASSSESPSVDIVVVADCIREHCLVEFVRCERSVECFVSETDPLRLQLQGCVDSSCDLDGGSGSPLTTLAPTVGPTNAGGLMTRVGLHVLAPYEISDIAYQEIVVGQKGTVPAAGTSGHLFLHSPCNFPAEDDGRYVGKIALFDRGLQVWSSVSCNIYDALRMLDDRGVVGALIANEENGGVEGVVPATWLGRDINAGVFLLGIQQSSVNTLRVLLRRNPDDNGVTMRLQGPPGSCDTAHVSAVVVPDHRGVDGGGSAAAADAGSCCAASDVVLAKIMYDFDYWELGVRLSPFCAEGTDLVPSSCVLLTDVLAEADMCMVDAKVNGICEDGGHGADAATTGYGMDCGDCGVRTPTAHTHGYPSDASVETAREYICEREGCQAALVSRYAAYFEAGNFFSNRLESLCSETKCSVPGVLREYDFGEDAGLDRTCCVAARVAVADIGFNALANLATLPLLSDRLCPDGDTLIVDGITPVQMSCRSHTSHDGVLAHLPSPKSVTAAKNRLCDQGSQNAGNACMTSVAEDMLRELILMDRLDGLVDVAFERDVVGHVDLQALWCDSVPLEICWASKLFFYSTPASTATAANGNEPGFSEPVLSCCEASRVLLHELRWQDALDRGDAALNVNICHEPGSLSSTWAAATFANMCSDGEKVNRQLLGLAKDTVLTSEGGACRVSFLQLVEGGKADFPQLRSQPDMGSIAGSSTAVEVTSFESSPFWTSEACWVSASLGITTPLVGVEDRVCAAINALVSRTAWLNGAKWGHLYFPTCPRSVDGLDVSCLDGLPIPDERTIKESSDIICNAEHLRTIVESGIDGKLQEAEILLHGGLAGHCHDPCRCVEECGFHDESHGRPYCLVHDSLACPRAYLDETSGRSRVHCPLGHDSCQGFHPEPGAACSPFIPEGASVFVPRGETIETLGTIDLGDTEDVSDTTEDVALTGAVLTGAVLGSDTGDVDVLRAWMLEAALVSVTCLRTHGQLVCDSRYKQCVPPETDAWVSGTALGALPWSTESRQALVDASTPVVKVCKADCERAVAFDAHMCGGVVYNSLLFAASKGSAQSSFSASMLCDMQLDPVEVLEGNPRISLYGVYGGDFIHSVLSLGEGIFAEEGESSCQRSMDWASPASSTTRNSSYFGAEEALVFVSCPDPWVKQAYLDTAQVEASLRNAPLQWTDEMRDVDTSLPAAAYFDNRFCLSPCPSFAYSSGEYVAIWLCYVLPGMLALVLNLLSLLEITYHGRLKRWAKSRWATKVGAFSDTSQGSGTQSEAQVSSSSVTSTHANGGTEYQHVRTETPPQDEDHSNCEMGRQPSLPSPLKGAELSKTKSRFFSKIGRKSKQKVAMRTTARTASQTRHKVTVETYMLILLSTLYGAIGVLPTLLLQDRLPCGDGGTEKSFVESASSVWCMLNRGSTFVLQSILFCIAWKALVLQINLQYAHLGHAKRERIKGVFGTVSVALPLVLCLLSFFLEDMDPRSEQFNLHLARSSVFCRMRFASYEEEFALLYLPMALGLLITVLSLGTTLRGVVNAYVRVRVIQDDVDVDHRCSKLRLMATAVCERPQILYILKLTVAMLVQFCLLVSIVSVTAPTLAAFQAESVEWLKCVRYIYARESLFGADEWSRLDSEVGLENSPCPAFPEDRPSVALQSLGSLSEVLVPLTVALFFSLKKIQSAIDEVGRSALQACVRLNKGIYSILFWRTTIKSTPEPEHEDQREVEVEIKVVQQNLPQVQPNASCEKEVQLLPPPFSSCRALQAAQSLSRPNLTSSNGGEAAGPPRSNSSVAGPPKANVPSTFTLETSHTPLGNEDSAPHGKATTAKAHSIHDPNRPKARWEFDSDAKFRRGTCKREL
jgi:hypothetical protein